MIAVIAAVVVAYAAGYGTAAWRHYQHSGRNLQALIDATREDRP
jgi:hypothetical protein